jgi:sodium-type flagellar protein MotY
MLLRFPLLHPLVIAWCLVLASAANAQMYSADLTNSEWKLSAGPFACSLTHNIPVFGKAVFARKAGGAEGFYLESQGKVVFPAGIAGAETLPPLWRNDLVPVPLGAFGVVAGNQPISLKTAQIAPLVAQLTSGVNVMYSSQPVATASSCS